MSDHARLPRKPAPVGRQADSCLLIGSDEVSVCPASDDVMLAGLEKRWIPMPRGRGYRTQVRCPACDSWVKDLYQPAQLGGDPREWRCRHCWNFHYVSQYSGRRPACDPERMEALLDSALRAHKRGNKELSHWRAERFFAAMDSYETRMTAYQLAELERGWADLQRDLARIDRQEAKAKWKRRHRAKT